MRRIASRFCLTGSVARLSLPITQRSVASTHLIPAANGGFVLGCKATEEGGWLYSLHTPSDKPVEARQPYPVLVIDFSSSMVSYDFARFADEAVIAYVNQFVRAARKSADEPDEKSDDQAAFKKVPAARLLGFSHCCVDHVISKADARECLEDCKSKLLRNTQPEMALRRVVDVVNELPTGSHIAAIFLTDGEFNGSSDYASLWKSIAAKLKSACDQRASSVHLCIVGLKNDSITNVREMCQAFHFANPEYVTITSKAEIVPAFVRAARVALGAVSAQSYLSLPVSSTSSPVRIFSDLPFASPQQAHVCAVVDVTPSIAFPSPPAALAAGLDSSKYEQWAPKVVDTIYAVETLASQVKAAATLPKDKLQSELLAARSATSEWLTAVTSIKQDYRALFNSTGTQTGTGAIPEDVWITVLEQSVSRLQQCVADCEHLLSATNVKDESMWAARATMSSAMHHARRVAARRGAVESIADKLASIDLSPGRAKVKDEGNGSTTVSHAARNAPQSISTALATLNTKYRCSITGRSWAELTVSRDALCLPITVGDPLPVDSYWEPSRLPIAKVGSLQQAICASEHTRVAQLFGAASWGAGTGVADLATATHVLPVRTDPLFAEKLNLFVAKLGEVCKNANTTESGFSAVHTHAYVAALRSVLADLATSSTDDARHEHAEKAVLLLYTYRGLLDKIRLSVGGQSIGDLLVKIAEGHAARGLFRSGWEAIAIALCANHSEYVEAAKRGAKQLDEFRDVIMKNACYLAYVTESIQSHRKSDNATNTNSAPPEPQAFDALFNAEFWKQWASAASSDTTATVQPQLLEPMPVEQRPWAVDFAHPANGIVSEPLRYITRHTSKLLCPPPSVTDLAKALCASKFSDSIRGALSFSLHAASKDLFEEFEKSFIAPAHAVAGVSSVQQPDVTSAVLHARLSMWKRPRILKSAPQLQAQVLGCLNREVKGLNGLKSFRQRAWECRFLPAVITSDQLSRINDLFALVRKQSSEGQLTHIDDFEARLRDLLRPYSRAGLDANNDDAKRDGTPRSCEMLFAAACNRSCILTLKSNGLPVEAIAHPSSPAFLLSLPSVDRFSYTAPLKNNACAWIKDLHSQIDASARSSNNFSDFCRPIRPLLEVVANHIPVVAADAFLEDCWAVSRK